jgi:hypothetical protein
MPRLFEVMSLLYKHEINCGLESDRDDAFQCWVGNAYSGYTAQSDAMNDEESIVQWLDREAKRSLRTAVEASRVAQHYLTAYERDSTALFGRVSEVDAMSSTSVNEVIKALYQRHIDCGVESLQGMGLTAWVVDDRNHRIERSFAIDELSSVGDWLRAEASRLYGSAEYVDNTHVLLAELADSERKDAKRVNVAERQRRHAADGRVDGTHN